MTGSLGTAAQKMFDSDVKQAFQQMGLLDAAVTIRKNVKASTYQFNKIGKGLANQKAIHENVTPMDTAHTQQVATLQKWYAPEYTDYFSNEEAPFDERQELVNVIAGALGRRKDQIILDAISDATISYAAGKTVAVSIGGSNTDLNVEKIIDAARILDEAGVPAEDRYFVAHTTGKAALLNTTKATSSDYNSVQALVKGQLKTFMGFTFIWINTRTEGGLPKSGNTRENYAFHKSAIGLAVGNDITAKTTWIDEKDAWLSNGKMRCGAVARDTDGLVLVETYEA
jgi:hypothetical protein